MVFYCAGYCFFPVFIGYGKWKASEKKKEVRGSKDGHIGGKWQAVHSLRIKKDDKEGIGLGFVELQRETILEKGEGT